MDIDMYGHETGYDAMEQQYGEEIMCAGWNPMLILMSQQQPLAPSIQQATLPADLATVDVESFLQQMYLHQR